MSNEQQLQREEKQLQRVEELAPMLGVSKGTIWRHVRLGTFPKPIHPFGRVTAWRKTDIDAWLAKKEGGAK